MVDVEGHLAIYLRPKIGNLIGRKLRGLNACPAVKDFPVAGNLHALEVINVGWPVSVSKVVGKEHAKPRVARLRIGCKPIEPVHAITCAARKSASMRSPAPRISSGECGRVKRAAYVSEAMRAAVWKCHFAKSQARQRQLLRSVVQECIEPRRAVQRFQQEFRLTVSPQEVDCAERGWVGVKAPDLRGKEPVDFRQHAPQTLCGASQRLGRIGPQFDLGKAGQRHNLAFPTKGQCDHVISQYPVAPFQKGAHKRGFTHA